ncbi:hypothetical protein KJ953_01805 [Patescibacteria group bacterium]|nr:hypothetical protein [Patescibacteria group bacterium]MBU1256353.1 hypothetical protein [Patescibacteria group bacterium]MBU1457504.1 hypothetical protein [Patescibacteria group bacterium]
MEKQRLLKCLTELNLPIILAIHLAFNRPDYDLDKLESLKTIDESIVACGLIGKPGDGKSATLAASAFKYGTFVANFDGYSKVNFNRYLETLGNSGLSKNCTVDEMMKVILELRESKKEKPETKGYFKSGGQVLDDLVFEIENRLKHKEKVDNLIACDMPGVLPDREADVFHVFCNAFEVTADIPDWISFADLPPSFLSERRVRYKAGLECKELFRSFLT